MTKRRKSKKLTGKEWTIISVIVAIVFGVPTVIFGIIPLIQSIPSSKLDVLIYTSTTDLIYSPDNTTVTGFNVTFSAQMTNTGNIPLTVAAIDILPKNNLPHEADYPYSNIKYLQPNENYDCNFTKLFNVSIPVKTGTIEQYIGVIGYRDSLNNYKWVLKDLWNPLG
jgi:hypothetical protein